MSAILKYLAWFGVSLMCGIATSVPPLLLGILIRKKTEKYSEALFRISLFLFGLITVLTFMSILALAGPVE